MFKGANLISERKSFWAEVLAAQKRMEHPNVIRYMGGGEAIRTINNKDKGPCLFVVSEYCEHGDLIDYIGSQNGVPPESVRYLMIQILDGTRYIHDMEMAHRDLKLENIFLDSNDVPKIADFGLQKALTSNLVTDVGSPCYKAPETS